ncbi:MAG: dTDP-glucose 4,6-dehydratase [Candidatus Zixiibacteriota bacterium]|nr:MAG: dTDP-glucose 4,6-dehydratase [candidate division Zixibacteria bacterium]
MVGNWEKRIAITGGAGFVGSNLLLYMVPRYSRYLFVNIDCLTYAGNLSNLASIEHAPNYRFVKLTVNDYKSLARCFAEFDINAVIHFAAETHVDRSIFGPADFISTNIAGTFNLLELARQRFDDGVDFRFHHISTDEVFGSLGEDGAFTEESPYRPNSPYSASKAGSDHLVRAYHRTYRLDTVISHCCNNFGPYQFPEKLVPLVINNALEGKPIPIYGNGRNIRDWLYIEDHCRALDVIFHRGVAGRAYAVSARNEYRNIDLVRRICRLVDEIKGGGPRERLIEFVSDRPGHDQRYAIDPSRIENELGWKAVHQFPEALRKTAEWYISHREWLDRCVSGEYLKYYEQVYTNR